MFKEIEVSSISENVFTLIGKEWMLITAGTQAAHNTMTASWGGLGFLWHKPVAIAFIRPQRYTKEFVEQRERFTLSFFGLQAQRKALGLLGSKSGRDGDKIAQAGLTPTQLDGEPTFAEARLVLVCKKLYQQDQTEGSFLDSSIVEEHYANKDFHTMYIAEIEKVYIQE